MDKIIFVLLLVSFHSYFVSMSPVSIDVSSKNESLDNDVSNLFDDEQQSSESTMNSEYAKEIIEEIKTRMLKSLHKTEAPRTHVPPPVLQPLSFEPVFESNETWDRVSKDNSRKTRTEFLQAIIENGTCFDENGSPCIKFHFGLHSQVQSEDIASAELWLFKTQDITDLSISMIDTIYNQGRLTTYVYNQTYSEGWIRFDVSHMLKYENVSTLDFEVSSEDGEISLDVEGDRKPFLLIYLDASKERRISKRSFDCTSENSTCCRQKYYVSFSDIGWGEWVIQPEGFDANYCRGSCSNNVGLPQKHHGRIFMAFCEKNPHKAKSIGKSECISCSPMSYQSMSVIYSDEDGIQVVSHMLDMSVSKCGCL